MSNHTTFHTIGRALSRKRVDRRPVHYHGGVTGRVHLCDDARCSASGRGSRGWGT